MRALDDILQNLDAEQKKAVTAPTGPVCMIAGAGTGKTTALVARIQYQVAVGAWQPEAVLALTHSTKAAGNMRDRLLSKNNPALKAVTLKTFHATCLMICKQYWEKTGRSFQLELLSNTYNLVREAMRKNGVKDPDTTKVLDLSSEIGWAKSSLVTPIDYVTKATLQMRQVSDQTPQQIAKYYQSYEDLLQANQKIDFSDLLIIATQLLNTDEQVRTQVQAKYKHFLVDEYQDTDPAQQAFLDALLGSRNDITVVGDKRQAIYAFKGADVSLLENFPQRFENSAVVRLVRDYRSTPQIAEFANLLMATPASDALIGIQKDGPLPNLFVAEDENQEAELLANKVKNLVSKGVPPSQIAVLYRYNAQSAAFETALGAVGLAVTVLDSEKFFDRPEIVSVLRSTWSRMLQTEAASDTEKTGLDLLGQALFNAGFNRENPPGVAGGARERWEAYNALLELATIEQGRGNATPRQLLDELAVKSTQAHQVSTQTITLSTLHKAKGLEWEAVFLPRMVEGSLPSAYAITAAAQDEEQRLAYVGITRAASHLFLSYARTRGSATRKWPATPSRYLGILGLLSSTKSKQSSQKRQVVTKAQITLTGTDLELFAKLSTWRLAKAKVTGMPAFVVASDAALTLICQQKPANKMELLRIPGFGLKNVEKHGTEILSIVTSANSK